MAGWCGSHTSPVSCCSAMAYSLETSEYTTTPSLYICPFQCHQNLKSMFMCTSESHQSFFTYCLLIVRNTSIVLWSSTYSLQFTGYCVVHSIPLFHKPNHWSIIAPCSFKIGTQLPLKVYSGYLIHTVPFLNFFTLHDWSLSGLPNLLIQRLWMVGCTNIIIRR